MDATAGQWAFDHELTAPAVRDLACACGLEGDVESIGEGWDYAMFRCDGHVLRIPKRADAAEALHRELALLRSMPRDLPLHVPRPRPDLVDVAGLAHPCMVYPFVPGTPLDEILPVPDVGQLGAQLGSFLRVVHDIAPTLPATDVDADDAEWVAETITTLETLRTSFGDAFTDDLTACVQSPLPRGSHRHRLVHGDLLAEHVLVGSDGTAFAVIDWGDADNAPWWVDLVGLYLWGGEACVAAASSAYGRELTDGERTRLRRRALLASINECGYELRNSDADDASVVSQWAGLLTRLLDSR